MTGAGECGAAAPDSDWYGPNREAQALTAQFRRSGWRFRPVRVHSGVRVEAERDAPSGTVAVIGSAGEVKAVVEGKR